MTEFRQILALLKNADVEFIVVGGVAAIAHGTARATFDVDVVYSRTPENIDRVVAALDGYNPYPRDAPKGLPFQWDARSLTMGCNFTLETTLGKLDLLGAIAGGGNYSELIPFIEMKTIYGVDVQCLTLEKLIETKRAAGRPKDFEPIAELEALLKERDDEESLS